MKTSRKFKCIVFLSSKPQEESASVTKVISCNKRVETVATPPVPSPTSPWTPKGLYAVYMAKDTLCYKQNACVPSKFIGWNITPRVMVWGDGALGRWLDLEGGAPLNGFQALIKETPQSSLASSAKWRYNKSVTCKNPLLWPCWQPDLGLPASRAATEVPDVPKWLGCIVSS